MSLHVCVTCGQQHIVRVPINGEDGLTGSLRCFETRQLLSSSNEQIVIALVTIGQGWRTGWRRRSYLVPLEITSLFPNGLRPTNVTVRLLFSNTRVGFHSNRPGSWGGV